MIRLAIVLILSTGLSEHKIAAWPKNPVLKNPEAQTEIADAIEEAAAAYDLDPWLLLATAYRESGFRHGVIGKRGERSLFQISPGTAALVAEREPLCTLTTRRGAAYCASWLLSRGREVCGSMRGALIRYVSAGGVCVAGSDRVRWIAGDRLRLARRMKKAHGMQKSYSTQKEKNPGKRL